MLKTLFRISILIGCFSFAVRAATAQEIVHALIGTVSAINANDKTITVNTDDGSDGTFHFMEDPHTPIKFDKGLRSESTAATDFKTQDARVIVYYFGAGGGRTVVALKALGAGPFTKFSGTVVKYDKKEHSLSVQDQTGAIQSFTVASSTIAETDEGASEGLKFDPHKGQRVNVAATGAAGSQAAVYINGALGF